MTNETTDNAAAESEEQTEVWKNVDTTKAMVRYVSDTKEQRKKLPRT